MIKTVFFIIKAQQTAEPTTPHGNNTTIACAPKIVNVGATVCEKENLVVAADAVVVDEAVDVDSEKINPPTEAPNPSPLRNRFGAAIAPPNPCSP